MNRYFFFILIFFWSCTPGSNNTTYLKLSDTDKAKFDKYMILGEAVYNNTCLNCHQKNGKGVHGLIPPLAKSDYLKNYQSKIPCLLHNGSVDSLIVNGRKYPPQMPAHDVSNLELAEVVTYINNAWGNEYGFVPVKQVDLLLKNCD